MEAQSMHWMIDTLRYAKSLENAGIRRKEAELQSLALAEALEGATQTLLATKEDVREVEKKIDAVELRLSNQIQDMMFKTIVILGGLMTCLTALSTFVHLH